MFCLSSSDIKLFRYGKRIIDLYTEVPESTFDLEDAGSDHSETNLVRDHLAHMGWTPTNVCPKVNGRGGVPVQFTVGLKLKGKTDHIAVDAEDALIAALKVKTEHPEAVITYVRQQNRRGDARHPSHVLDENTH